MSLGGLKKSVVQGIETYAIPVKLQQLYKGYRLRDRSLGETGMPVDFLITLAQLAKHIYLTGTKSAHSKEDTPFAISLRTELGVLFQNYMQLNRFDAATGLFFETRGPFGAVVASAVPPGLERLPVKGKVHPKQARYRLFIVFRGTVPAIGDLYTDDLSTDAKAAAPKLDNCVGNEAGEVARGFLNTYTSCRTKILTELLPRGYEYLRKQHQESTKQMGHAKGHAQVHNRLTDAEIELYVVGHSLGGAVATLCAYDIACLTPHLDPVLVTFGSPPVGNIDFAIDFNRVMVERHEYHPRTRYLRSIRVVARTKDGKLDAVSAIPEKLPNYIHVNTRVLIPSSAESRMGAHSMKDSYIESLTRQKN